MLVRILAHNHILWHVCRKGAIVTWAEGCMPSDALKVQPVTLECAAAPLFQLQSPFGTGQVPNGMGGGGTKEEAEPGVGVSTVLLSPNGPAWSQEAVAGLGLSW